MHKTLFFLFVMLLFCCNSDHSNLENIQFNRLIGGIENRLKLDDFISKMESKIISTYEAKSISENYSMFLEDILNVTSERIIKYDTLDCQLIYNFENTTLASQYELLKYDTVYLDGGIVTIDKNGTKEIEIPYGDSIEILNRIGYLKGKGYKNLTAVGNLTSALNSDELINIEVNEYYRIKNKSCFPMFENYIETMQQQPLDFNNYIVKSNIFYEIYMTDILYNFSCDKFEF